MTQRVLPGRVAAPARPVRDAVRATLWIAAPIAAANLSQIAMAVTDSVMLGGIGEDALAAGGLGANFFFTCLFSLQSVLAAAGVLAARARGAGRGGVVPVAYWSGAAVGVGLAIVAFAVLSAAGPILRGAGESAALAADVAIYLDVLRWGVPAAIVMGLLRAFLPAVGQERLLLWVVPSAVVLNAALNWQLIYGGFGVPGFGLRGSAAATAVTLWLMAAVLAVLFHRRPGARAFVRPARVSGRMMREVLTLGLPIAGAAVMESVLFLAVGVTIGALGTAALAAQNVALNAASVAFMVPYAIGQAANVRVSLAAGAGRMAEARRAGLVAIALGAAAMAVSGTVMVCAPGAIARAYLGEGAAALPVTIALLRVGAMFALVDGVQVVAAGALRGLKDTRVPLAIAAVGYWGIGFWLGRALAFGGGFGAAGLWLGLFAGLAVAAVCLTARFLFLTRRTARLR